MQTHLSDWYKILDIETHEDETLFEKRNQALVSIKKLIIKSKEWEPLFACIEGVSGGFELLGEDNSFTQDVIRCIKTYVLSFPSNLRENSLELRVACGAVIEEIITGDIGENDEANINSTMAALLLLSSIGLRTPPTEKFLQENYNRLKETANNYLESRAISLRKRQSLDYSFLGDLSSPPDATTWTSFRDHLVKVLSTVEMNSAADREEMELLWWMQNAYSKKLKQPLRNLSPISAAIIAALETSEMVVLPPIDSTILVIRMGVEKGRSKPVISPKPLSQLIDKKDMSTWTILAKSCEEVQNLVTTFPPLLPLTWLGIRFKDSRGVADWEKEFEQIVGISIERQFSPAEIAEQVFREQMVIRLLNE